MPQLSNEAKARQALRVVQGASGAAPGPDAAKAHSRAPFVRQRRGQARGNIPTDPLYEPVLLRRSGRERGGTLYLAREILAAALTKAGLDPATPTEDLIVMRKILGGRRRIAQVLLEIRVRKGATP